MIDVSKESTVIEMYKMGYTIEEIRKEANISNGEIYRCLDRNGIKKRKTFNLKPKENKNSGYKYCPVCKSRSNPVKAKFCCMCGADIRSSKDILLERLEIVLSNCLLLPENMKAETIEIIREVIQELRK